MDDPQLALFALLHHRVVGARAIPPTDPFIHQMAQVSLRRVALGHLEVGQMVPFRLQIDLAHLADQARVVERLGDLAEEVRHLLRRAQVVAAVAHAHTVGLTDQRPRLDAQQHIVRAGLFRIHIVHVVGGDELQVETTAELLQLAVELAQPRDVVVLQLEEEVLRAEHVPIPLKTAQGFLLAALFEQARQFGGGAA